MSKLDTKKIYKYNLLGYYQPADILPHKKYRKFKRKERQDGKKECQEALKNRT